MLLMMLGSAISSQVVRCAWNRFSPRAKPFMGVLRNSFSTLNKQTHQGKEARLRLLSRPCQNTQGNRGLKESAKKGGDNTVLFVGLGALGFATVVAVQSNIFTLDNKAKKPSESSSENLVVTGNAEVNIGDTDDSHDQTEEILLEKANEDGTDENIEIAVVEKNQSEVKDAQAKEVTAEEQPEAAVTITSEEPSEAKQEESIAEVATEETVPISKEIKVEDSSETKQEEVIAVEEAVKKNAYKDLPKVPEFVPYVIIGGGTASHAACRAIRKHDPKAKILVIGEEEVLPYMRPPLSKELWFSEDEDSADTLFFKQWNGKRRSVFFEDDTYYVKPQLLPVQENGGVAVLTGQKVVDIDPVQHTVHLKRGEGIKYEKLLIATGGYPKSLDIFTNASDDLKSKVTLFRTVADYRKLEKQVGSFDSVAIIGGGFLGSELACALGARGKKSGMVVSQIYHENGNMGKVLPNYLSEWTTKKVENEGVKTYANVHPVNGELNNDGKVSIHLNNGETIDASHVIICVGIEPNTDLAKSAGLELDSEHGGFRVNSELQARSDIWVAGDAACFYDVRLGRRRVEHHDHAVVSGRLAGENMTGAKKAYLHQSMFWSDLGPDVGYEAIGIVDNTLDTVGIWAKATEADSPKAVVEATGENLRSQTEEDAETGESVSVPADTVSSTEGTSEAFGKGVVFYLKDQVIVGVLLWNVFNKMPVARKILKEGKKQDSLVEVAKLFNIHE